MLHSRTTPWEVGTTIPSATANETAESWSVAVKIQVCFFVYHGFYNRTQYHPDPFYWPWVKVTFYAPSKLKGHFAFQIGLSVRSSVRSSRFLMHAISNEPFEISYIDSSWKTIAVPYFFLSGKFVLLELCPFKNQNKILSAKYLTIWARASKLCELIEDDEKITWSWRGILIFKWVVRSFVCPFVKPFDAYHI